MHLFNLKNKTKMDLYFKIIVYQCTRDEFLTHQSSSILIPLRYLKYDIQLNDGAILLQCYECHLQQTLVDLSLDCEEIHHKHLTRSRTLKKKKS